MTAIGELKRRIVFQRSVLAPDGAGGFDETWEDVAEVPAAVAALSGSERSRFARTEAAVTHRICVRWRDDITPALRVVEGDAVYNIFTCLDRDGTQAWLEILAAEIS